MKKARITFITIFIVFSILVTLVKLDVLNVSPITTFFIYNTLGSSFIVALILAIIDTANKSKAKKNQQQNQRNTVRYIVPLVQTIPSSMIGVYVTLNDYQVIYNGHVISEIRDKMIVDSANYMDYKCWVCSENQIDITFYK